MSQWCCCPDSWRQINRPSPPQTSRCQHGNTHASRRTTICSVPFFCRQTHRWITSFSRLSRWTRVFLALHHLHLLSHDGDNVWLFPKPPNVYNHPFFSCSCSRWGHCSHTAPQRGLILLWPLVNHGHICTSPYNRKKKEIRHLPCTVTGKFRL